MIEVWERNEEACVTGKVCESDCVRTGIVWGDKVALEKKKLEKWWGPAYESLKTCKYNFLMLLYVCHMVHPVCCVCVLLQSVGKACRAVRRRSVVRAMLLLWCYLIVSGILMNTNIGWNSFKPSNWEHTYVVRNCTDTTVILSDRLTIWLPKCIWALQKGPIISILDLYIFCAATVSAEVPQYIFGSLMVMYSMRFHNPASAYRALFNEKRDSE